MSRNPTLPIAAVVGPLKVAIVSADPLVRAGLASLIEGADDAEIAQLGDANVAVWDPGAEKTQLAGRLGDLQELRVPTVAVLSDEGQAGAALAAGARGVVLRDQVGPGLVAALSAVRCGLTVLDPALAERTIRVPERSDAGDIEQLTARETEVIGLLAQGLSNKRIAKRLGISEHTAKFHVNSILTKLDADTRTEAVVHAVRRGLVIL